MLWNLSFSVSQTVWNSRISKFFFFKKKNKHVIKTLYVSSIKQTQPWMWTIAECNWRSSRTIKKRRKRKHLYVLLLDWCTTLSNCRHIFPLFLLSTVHVALMAFNANESISRSLLSVGSPTFFFPCNNHLSFE